MNIKILVIYAAALVAIHLLVSACYLAVYPRPEQTYFGPWIIYWLPIVLVVIAVTYRNVR